MTLKKAKKEEKLALIKQTTQDKVDFLKAEGKELLLLVSLIR